MDYDRSKSQLRTMTRIRLRAGCAQAEIASKGAEALAWRIGGRPLLWSPEPAFWFDTAPVLFPVVGWTAGGRIKVGEAFYPLGLHGFARHEDFVVAKQMPDYVRLELASGASTLARYPFEFCFCVEYWLKETSLEVVLTVANPSTRPLPYACGLHPGFCWPFAGGTASDYCLRFAAVEKPLVPEISSEGLFLPNLRGIPLEGELLPLTTDLFAKEALCFLFAQSRCVRFEHRPSGSALVVEAQNFPHFAFWSRPGAPFLSIETWTGYGDPHDFAGDIFEKPGMRVLAQGATARHAACYNYVAGGGGTVAGGAPGHM
jgi:galactose mutarotase-like enzyme